jgi:hypothetical protein
VYESDVCKICRTNKEGIITEKRESRKPTDCKTSGLRGIPRHREKATEAELRNRDARSLRRKESKAGGKQSRHGLETERQSEESLESQSSKGEEGVGTQRNPIRALLGTKKDQLEWRETKRLPVGAQQSFAGSSCRGLKPFHYVPSFQGKVAVKYV